MPDKLMFKMINPIVIDFETEAIESRPVYPPRPVGVAVKLPGGEAKYFAWGHPEENNSTFEVAKGVVSAAWGAHPIVFHNAKFDMEVAMKHFGLPPLPRDMWHDTMLLAYLDDPHAKAIGLKPLSESLLGIPPTERDDLQEWVLAHVQGATRKDWGAHISKAPGSLVGRYAASGDAEMTAALFDYLHPRVIEAGMGTAYDRERDVVQVLMDCERKGIRVDALALKRDVPMFELVAERLDAWIRQHIGAPEDMNIDSGDQLADALEKAGMATDFAATETGKRSTSKASLADAVSDPLLILALEYRGTLATFLRTFMRPWRATSSRTDGWIYTDWNSTKQDKGGGSRTGRLSSSPNFQNIPSDEKRKDLADKLAPLFAALDWLPALPSVRAYILADDDDSVLIGRDYSQQEPRVLSHFEDGGLMAAYKANPRMDIYNFAGGEVKKITGVTLSRKAMKVIILAIMYGLGMGKLAERLGCSVAEARAFKGALLVVFPGLAELDKDLKTLAKKNEPMKTWGGRRYHVEPPKVVSGTLRSFDYKLLNYLIQGSSADITKEAMLRYNKNRKHGRLALSVHDEILVSVPARHWKEEMKILQDCMNGVELDVPLVSDGAMGKSWGSMEDLSDEG